MHGGETSIFPTLSTTHEASSIFSAASTQPDKPQAYQQAGPVYTPLRPRPGREAAKRGVKCQFWEELYRFLKSRLGTDTEAVFFLLFFLMLPAAKYPCYRYY